MTHTYNISGMTCGGCQAKVTSILSQVRGVRKVEVDLPKGEAHIEMTRYIPLPELKSAFKNHPRYELSENVNDPLQNEGSDAIRSWLRTYKPILLIFTYILGTTILVQTGKGTFNFPVWMSSFTGRFFLVFSFFKFINLQAFVDSYTMYDVIARKWHPWGYV